MGKAASSQYPPGVDGRRRRKPSYERNLHRMEAMEARQRDWKLNFLRAYAETGNVSKSCRIANVDPKLFYRTRRDDDEFAEAFQIAHRAATDKVLEAAWQMGVEGEREPIVWQGEIVGYVKRRTWNATKFLLETYDPGTYSQRERIARMGMMQADELNKRRDEMLAATDERIKQFGSATPQALPEIVDAEVEED